MSEQIGEKTEHATPRRLEEAYNKGQFPRSAEVQTVVVLLGAVLALSFTGQATWRQMARVQTSVLGHLHDVPVTADAMQGYAINAFLVVASCVWPVLAATMLGGLLAGGLQNRFRASPEALTVNWGRLNPLEGLKRLFSFRSAVPTGLGLLKLTVVLTLSYGVIEGVMSNPIFFAAVDVARIAGFLAESSSKIILRVIFALAVIASLDYAYQFWRNTQDMMMTKEEVKEESKNAEGNPEIKARQRRKRQAMTKRKMLAEVPKADVIVTNPTHLAVALRYDRKSMKAPKIVAKGSRLNALRIREIAREHQIPIIENKPLARMMFKYGKVGGEIPAQLYAAVAEVLAWVYRVNAYRYYREQQQT